MYKAGGAGHGAHGVRGSGRNRKGSRSLALPFILLVRFYFILLIPGM